VAVAVAVAASGTGTTSALVLVATVPADAAPGGTVAPFVRLLLAEGPTVAAVVAAVAISSPVTQA